MELVYIGYTGILGDVFKEVKVNIEDDLFIVNVDGLKRVFKIVYNNSGGYVYKFTKKTIKLCQDRGLKHFIEAQDKKDVFFSVTRSMLESMVLETKQYC